MHFSDTVDAWIHHEFTRNHALVDQSTIQEKTVGSLPGKRYQPEVIGTCNAGSYVLKVSADRLLLIDVDCLDQEPYRTILQSVEILNR